MKGRRSGFIAFSHFCSVVTVVMTYCWNIWKKRFSAGEVKETRKKNTLDTKTLPGDREQQGLGAIFCLLNGIEITGSNEAPRGISFC